MNKQRGFTLIAVLLMIIIFMIILVKFGAKFGHFFGPPATLEDVENIPDIKDRTNTLEKQIKERYPGN